ncbi:MAG: PKD domain-containing protein [Candidatus Gracilibacteria bacterium]|nr:PKD domain-containing protein [Candidatus Gracilibacteria bacterium]
MSKFSIKILVGTLLVASVAFVCFAEDNNVLDACGVNGINCSMDNGINNASNGVIEIVKNNNGFKDYVQNTIIKNILAFLGIFAVALAIYAGFMVMNANGDEAKVKKGKTILFQVIMGMGLIFLAWAIVSFVVTKVFTFDIFSNQVYAADVKKNFNDYKRDLESLKTDLESEQKINGRISSVNLARLTRLVDSASKTLPDNDNVIFNENIKKKIVTNIKMVEKYPNSSTALTDLIASLDAFINKLKILQITSKIFVTPQSYGNAPFTVTLRASDTVDPTGNSVPSENYTWFVKDSTGVRKNMGHGPSIPFTFQKEGTYFIYLEIISSRRNSAGYQDVLPFVKEVKIDVGPAIGYIKFYINKANVSGLDIFKITPNAGKSGVLLDASSSYPTGSTTFKTTTWDFGNGNKTTYNGSPKTETQYYFNEGVYDILLTLETNEGKKIEKKVRLQVKKPIASIASEKTTGFIGDEFKFSANSYLEQDAAFKYNWEIQDLGTDETVFRYTHPNLSYTFKKVGRYAVRLTTTATNGEVDSDSFVIIIDGKGPKAVFDAVRDNPETPNIFVLDGSKSYDQDYANTKLKYKWYIDGQEIELTNATRGGALGKYIFNSLGTHKITLEVQNAEGKIGMVTKEIEIISLLGVKLVISPRIALIGRNMNFVAEAKNVASYEWDFGDGETVVTSVGRAAHAYKKSGKFSVALTVRNGADSNTITRFAYIKTSDSPFALIKIKKDADELRSTLKACNGQEAYVINRADNYTLSAEDSVNVEGIKSENLSYSWTVLDKSSSQESFSFKFNDLGCYPIKLTVKDKKNNKSATIKSFVKIENLPPKISGISISAQNKTGDPIVLNIKANNAVDPDGLITSYLWYYYTDSDPEPQGFRITSKPETAFVIPKMPSEYNGGYYYFNVIAEDTNGAKTNLEENSGEKYSVPIFTGDNVNIPIIDLKTSNTSIAVGDEVKFDVTIKNFLGKELKNNIEYKWDFDGDGFYDKTTTDASVVYKYSKPGVFTAKVKVNNKGISNTKSQLISVKNVLKSDFKTLAIGDKLVLFNISTGFYSTAKWKVGEITATNPYFFVQDYSDIGDYPSSVTLDISDGQDIATKTKEIKKDTRTTLIVKKLSDKLVYFTYPETDKETIHIKDSNQKLFVYLGASKGTISKYSIDMDTSVDSDLNGTKDDDEDNKNTESYVKGDPFVIKDFSTRGKESTMRLTIYDENGKTLQSKDVNVVLDFVQDVVLNEQTLTGSISEIDRVNLERLKNLIKDLPEKDRLIMMQYYVKLQENWFDSREKTRIIIDFESYIENESPLDKQKKGEFYTLLEGFLVSDGQMNDQVTLAATTLKNLIPTKSPNYQKITGLLDEILSHPTDLEKNKELGKQILELVEKDNTIENNDKLIIKAQLKTIIESGAAPEGVNIGDAGDQGNTSSQGGGSILGTIFKVLLAILGVIGLLFGGLYVYFLKTKKEEDTDVGFQDFIIEKFLSGRQKEEIDEYQDEDILSGFSSEPKLHEEEKGEDGSILGKQEGTEQSNGVPDWLKGVNSGQTEDENKEDNVDVSGNKENETPDWLRGTSDIESNFENEEEDTALDWLKGQTKEETQDIDVEEEKKEENTLTPSFQESELDVQKEQEQERTDENDNNKQSIQSEEPKMEIENIPDWLKGDEQEEIIKEDNEEVQEQKILEDASVLVTEEEPKTKDANLPDWLKGDDQQEEMFEDEENVFEQDEKKENKIESVYGNVGKKDNKKKKTYKTDVVPDWLKGVNEKELEKEIEEELSDKPNMTEKKNIKRKKDSSKKPGIKKSEHQIKKENNKEKGKSSDEMDDIPDWLKGSV